MHCMLKDGIDSETQQKELLFMPLLTAFPLSESLNGTLAAPSERYDPQSSASPWTKNAELAQMAGHTKELFYRVGRSVHYAGTYRVLPPIDLPYETALLLGVEYDSVRSAISRNCVATALIDRLSSWCLQHSQEVLALIIAINSWFLVA